MTDAEVLQWLSEEEREEWLYVTGGVNCTLGVAYDHWRRTNQIAYRSLRELARARQAVGHHHGSAADCPVCGYTMPRPKEKP